MPAIRHLRPAALALAVAGALAALAAGVFAPGALARLPTARAVAAHTHVKHSANAKHKRACARRSSYRLHSKRRHHCAAHRKHARVKHTSAGTLHKSLTGAPSTQGSRTSAADLPQCVNATITPSAANLALVREATLCLVNRERAQHGESPLALEPSLERSAQGHSESMSADAYFEHVGPGGDTPLARMRAAGYIDGAQSFEVGENIGWGTLWLGSPRAIVAAWMASPGHRANILDSHYRDTGVGVSARVPRSLGHGQAGGIYTQDFGVRG